MIVYRDYLKISYISMHFQWTRMCWSSGEKDAKILFVWGHCEYGFSYGINWYATKVRKYL